ncbi:carboxylesterase/lipase family protein [Rhodococcus sp. NPDC058521]|uniref:carboxylesterase/lipase family protein n=1 Tax=Rhodococcus sp. NPDC058521 TaxID=3346536 RepID=UPI0036662BD0
MNERSTHLRVVTDAGEVLGREVDGVSTWRGIPYAAPPVGPDRFRAPKRATPWSGVLNAHEYGPHSVQPSVKSSEDCLLLNVVTPLGAPNDDQPPRAVMVFVHGGGYSGGSSASGLYGGSSLVRRGDIVYVSLNYRLGALGYLDFSRYSTPERTFDSNLGLRDQVAALEWVRRNIAAFGGDPDNVTLFGESAGGGAVTTLMTTPAAEGLFTRAIAQSPWSAAVYGADRAARWAHEFIETAGVDDAEACDWLSTTEPKRLAEIGRTLAGRVADDEPGTRVFAPTVDSDFLPEHPMDVFAAGKAHPVPLIVGTNAHEGRVFPFFLNILPTDRNRIERMFAGADSAVVQKILDAYPKYPKRFAAADLGGDMMFWLPSIAVTEGHSRTAPTYSYRYDFATRLLRITGFGATHATEMYAVFGLSGLWRRVLTLLGGADAFARVTDSVQNHWLHFTKHGAPESDWPTYDAEDRKTLLFDDVDRVERDPRRHRRLAWEGYEYPR